MMRIATLFLSLCLPVLLTAQCDGDRFFNQVFNDFVVDSDIQYGANLDLNGENVNLLLDVYRPYGDDFFERPLVVLVHGGSFVGGSKIGNDVVPLARDLAKMGYVVASINYRLGLPFSLDLEQPATQAVIRGYHDAKAAVRFFRKDVEENGNSYGIDPEKIYMAGVSAGGFVALHNGYLDEESEIPTVIDQTLPGLGGGLEGESGNPGYSSEIMGVVNIAGAIGDADWMQAGDVPVLSFHGDLDGTVPYGTDMLQLLGFVDVVVVDGSESVHQRADEVGITNCFVPHFGADHVPHVSNVTYYDTTRAITANFLGHLTCPTEPLDCEYREVTLDVSELAERKMTLYPNPVRDVLRLEFSGIRAGQIDLYDVSGRIVLTERMQGQLMTLPVGHLPKGMYIVQVLHENGRLSERLIIE